MRLKSEQKGFTLVELMVAVAVLAIGILALLASMSYAVRLSRTTREINAANFTLVSVMEDIAGTPFDDIPEQFPNGQEVTQIGGVEITGSDYYRLQDQTVIVNHQELEEGILEVRATISWLTGTGRDQSMSLVTVRTR
jgi:prepilin-type N-terminal cleavage/methylation domain-containing protein